MHVVLPPAVALPQGPHGAQAIGFSQLNGSGARARACQGVVMASSLQPLPDEKHDLLSVTNV